MIRCTKCHIDKDRCDCPQKAGTVVTYIMIAIAAIGCVFGAVNGYLTDMNEAIK